jgi:rare lipoprotein A
MDRPIVSRRASAYVVMLGLGIGSAVVAPSLSWASSGGATPGPSGGGGVTTNKTPVSPNANNTSGVVQTGNPMVTASGNGITITARASAVLRDQLRFAGTVPQSASGDTIEIERRGRETGWGWAPTTHGTARSGGSFTAVWPTNHIGQFAIRAVIEGRGGTVTRAVTPSPAMTIIVYRRAIATLYGPGFYGQRTACGETLKPGTLGVANRTLKCGTKVAIYYRGRTMVVPVIDRGPYANHADWDLTEATGRALGLDGTATIDAVSLHTH